MKKIQKIKEYIELLNKGYIPKPKDPHNFFSNGKPLNRFFEFHQDEIAYELNNNSLYEIGYDIAKDNLNKYKEKKINKLSNKDKIKEYIEKLNKGYIPKTRDSFNFFSNGKSFNRFFEFHQDKIAYELNNNSLYEVGYDVARNIVNKYLKKESKKLSEKDKIKEYIEKLNNGYYPKKDDRIECFSNGVVIRFFWGNNKNKIINLLNNSSDYKNGYDKAKETINDYHEKKKNISNLSVEERIPEYIEKLNNGYIPINQDDNEYFNDNSPIGQFWHHYQKRIINELNTNSKYEIGYEIAKNAVKKQQEKLERKSNLSLNKRIKELIEKLNNGYIPKSEDKVETFSDNTPLNNIWSIIKKRIINELFTDKKYEIDFEKAKFIVLNKGIDKLSEYIEKLNNGYIPKWKELTETFSDNTVINSFFMRNRYKIIEELNANPKYQNGYDLAKKRMNEYLEKVSKRSKLTFEQKIFEYIEKLNNGYVPKANDQTEFFSDNTLINQFYSTNQTKILEELNTNPKYQNGYETAHMSLNNYLNSLKNKLTSEQKLIEYIELLNQGYIPVWKENKITFSNGIIINQYWPVNKDKINYMLHNNPNYQIGYNTAKESINKYFEKRRKKENREQIKLLLLEHGINYKEHKVILTKSYDEVYIKINYLLDNNIPILVNNKLHEIFFMSDINMQTIYNISLDTLINTYLQEEKKILKLN